MDFLTEEMLGYIPVTVCVAVLLIAGLGYLIYSCFKKK